MFSFVIPCIIIIVIIVVVVVISIIIMRGKFFTRITNTQYHFIVLLPFSTFFVLK